MKYTATWYAILFGYREGVVLEFLTPVKIVINKEDKKLTVSKRDYNLITTKSTTFWIRDIRSLELEKTLFGCNIHIRSRGNNIICKGFTLSLIHI